MLHVGTCLYYFEIVCLYRATVCEGSEGSWCIWSMLKHSGYSGDQREVRIWRSIPRFVGYIYIYVMWDIVSGGLEDVYWPTFHWFPLGPARLKKTSKWPSGQRATRGDVAKACLKAKWHDSHFSSLNGYMVDQQTPPRLQNVENVCFWMLLDAKFKCT